MPSYVVQPGDAKRVAAAIVRYQVVQPRLVAVMALALIVVVGLEAAFASVRDAVITAVLVLVVYLLVVLRARQRVVRAVLAGGYRPGAYIEASFGTDWFRVASGASTVQHDYRQVQDVWRSGELVIVRLAATRSVIALPLAAVGDEGLRYLGGLPTGR